MAVQSRRNSRAAAARGGQLHPCSKFINYMQYYTQKKAHEISNNFIPCSFVRNSTVWPEFAKNTVNAQNFLSSIRLVRWMIRGEIYTDRKPVRKRRDWYKFCDLGLLESTPVTGSSLVGLGCSRGSGTFWVLSLSSLVFFSLSL